MHATDRPVDPQETPRGKVLVVDDEPDVLESTALMIESLGYEAIRLADPGDILDTVAEEHPDLLLQDLRMRDLNVAGLVATLRSNPESAELPLVFFSASSDLATTAARYDAWGYLSKPFSRTELSNLLEHILGAREVLDRGRRGRNVKRDMRSLFHDYWDHIAALNNYLEVLRQREGLDEEAQRCVRGLEESLLKLEAKTDRLRSYIMMVVESVEPVPAEKGVKGAH